MRSQLKGAASRPWIRGLLRQRRLRSGVQERGGRTKFGNWFMVRSGLTSGSMLWRRWACGTKRHLTSGRSRWSWILGRSFIGVSWRRSRSWSGRSRSKRRERALPFRSCGFMLFYLDQMVRRGCSCRERSTYWTLRVGSRPSLSHASRGSRRGLCGDWHGMEAEERSVPQAGGVPGDKGDRLKAPQLIGPKLSTEEVNRARDRAPVDKNGVLLCWSNLTHLGCQVATCQRSHEPLRGQFEQLDPAVRMQLIRRGGLRRMKQETPQTAEAKIKELRQQVAQDKSEKVAKPKRKAGEANEENPEEASSRAGGEQRVKFNEIPEEFEAVDYTKQEDVQELLKAPDGSWGVPQRHQDRPHGAGENKAPEKAKDLVTRARRLSEGPVLKALEGASDDLYAWAAARVSREEGVKTEDLLEEMVLFGASDLAQEASELLEGVKPSSKAGAPGCKGYALGTRRTRSRRTGSGWSRMEDVGLPRGGHDDGGACSGFKGGGAGRGEEAVRDQNDCGRSALEETRTATHDGWGGSGGCHFTTWAGKASTRRKWSNGWGVGVRHPGGARVALPGPRCVAPAPRAGFSHSCSFSGTGFRGCEGGGTACRRPWKTAYRGGDWAQLATTRMDHLRFDLERPYGLGTAPWELRCRVLVGWRGGSNYTSFGLWVLLAWTSWSAFVRPRAHCLPFVPAIPKGRWPCHLPSPPEPVASCCHLWKRGEFGCEGRRAGGSAVELVWFWGETLWCDALDDLQRIDYEDEIRAGGRRKKENAVEKIGQTSIVGHLDPQPFDGDVKGRVDDWLEANMTGDKAESTTRAYASMWQRWAAWAQRQQWYTPYLNPNDPKLTNENKMLGFLGYLGWLGSSAASMKQALFAIKDAHKRAGYGDPTSDAFRVWVLINALDRRAARKPRRLGVTPGMLRWIGGQLETEENTRGETKVNATMLNAALLTAWFFMMRASEYCESGPLNKEMILRGVDVKLTKEGEDAEEGEANEVTVQFRKTKSDQEAFGSCKTMGSTGTLYLCPVQALEKYRKVAPARFKGGEAWAPLFRWADGSMLKRLEVQEILQRAARAEGLPADRFLSHSLRIGGASALFQVSADVELVKRMGRWSSAAVQRYLHDGGHVLKQLASKMANVDQRIHYTWGGWGSFGTYSIVERFVFDGVFVAEELRRLGGSGMPSVQGRSDLPLVRTNFEDAAQCRQQKRAS